MINLASRRKRPKGYVSIFTNVDTYYSHVCTFKNKKVTVVTTKETWEKLQELFEMYTKQVKKYKRHFVAWAMRDSVLQNIKKRLWRIHICFVFFVMDLMLHTNISSLIIFAK